MITSSRLREVSHKRTRIRSPYRWSRQRRDPAARAVRARASHISGVRGTQHHWQNHRRYATSGTIGDCALHEAVQCRRQGRSCRVWRQRQNKQRPGPLPQRRAYDTRRVPRRLPAARSACSESSRRVRHIACARQARHPTAKGEGGGVVMAIPPSAFAANSQTIGGYGGTYIGRTALGDGVLTTPTPATCVELRRHPLVDATRRCAGWSPVWLVWRVP
jgi:hypothetical protein